MATANASFSGANGKIAFDSNRNDPSPGTCSPCNYEIYTMNPDGSGVTRVTNNAAVDSDPNWSPDGTKIVFTSNRSGNNDIWVMNSNGTSPVNVTNNAAYDANPTWSPDGTKIAFTSDRSGNFDVWKTNADGSGTPTDLTNNPAHDTQATWFGNGGPEEIAFTTNRGGNFKIWEMNPDGTSPTSRTSGAGDDGGPNLRPDGGALSFHTSRDGNNEIYENLNDPAGGTTANPAQDILPAWAPDQSKIAFETNRDGNSEIYVETAQPGFPWPATNISQNAAADHNPDWQPVNPSYPHPVGASPLRAPLVPAFQPCDLGAHSYFSLHNGPPSGSLSCPQVTQASSTATIGNNSIGFIRYVVCPVGTVASFCTPTGGQMPLPDIRVTGSLRDAKCRGNSLGCSTGADYNPIGTTGPYTDGGNGTQGASPPCFPSGSSSTACTAGADMTLTASTPNLNSTSQTTSGQFKGNGLVITDKRNGPGQQFSATVLAIGFPVPMDCVPTADVTLGSACGVNTTMNALVPGMVVNGGAAVLAMGQVQIYDAGPNAIRGDGDDELLATQGLFAP